jgi:hypothetical protein
MQFSTAVPTFRQKGTCTADKKVTGSSETMERIHKLTWLNISEERNLNRHYYKNLETRTILKLLLVDWIKYFD